MKQYSQKQIKKFYSNDLNCNTGKFQNLKSVFSLPHIEKRAKGGEDAYYINSNILAVADGVGGWNSQGVDPALYSKELCRKLIIFLTNSIENEYTEIKEYSEKSAKDILVKSAYKTKAKGSSTCCLIIFDTNSNNIFTANIGDSGYLIIRYNDGNLKEFYKSQEQTHSFNFPYQV